MSGATPSITSREQRGGSISSGAVSVGTSAVQLLAASDTRQSFTLHNASANPIWIGPSGVLTGSGLQINAGETYKEEDCTAAIFAIAGSAGNNMRVYQVVD